MTVAGLVLEMRRRGSRMTLVLDDRAGAHRGQPLRRRLAAAPRGHRARRDPGRRGTAALRRVHRRLADQCEEADADRDPARARSAQAHDPPPGRRRRRRLLAELEEILRDGPRRALRGRRALHRRRGARHACPRRRVGRQAEPCARRRSRPPGRTRRHPFRPRAAGGLIPSILSVCRCNSWISSSRSPSSRRKSRS